MTKQRHWGRRLLINLFLIAIILGGAIWGGLYSLNQYTHHAERIKIPNVVRMNLTSAKKLLERNCFRYKVIDSVYNDSFPPGAVYEQNPKAGARAKQNRIVFLTINANEKLRVPFPAIDTISFRQAVNELKLRGFLLGDIEEVEVSIEGGGLVLGASYKGMLLKKGIMLPKGSVIDLQISKVEREASRDTLMSSPKNEE